MTMKYSRDIKIYASYDVVVCGGGPAGCAAALSARREGLSTLLVEESGSLGGMAVSGLVSQWLGGRTQEGEWVVGGLFKEMADSAASEGSAVIPYLVPGKNYHPYGWYNWFIHGVPLDSSRVAYMLDKKMSEAGVDVLLFTKFVDTRIVEGRITDVVLAAREGLVSVKAKAVVDATGNADVAFASGCPVVKGREGDGKMAPSSLVFHVYDVDTVALTKAIEKNRDPKFRDLISELRQKGIWTFPYDIFICTKLVFGSEYFVNTIRLVGFDGTDSASLSSGMRKGREEVFELMKILNEYFPGFKDAKVKSVAPSLGIRETRKIKGDFVLRVDDLMKQEEFDDTIGFSMYGWDLPDPDKPSVQPFASDLKSGFKPKVTKGLYTPIPYRVMIPSLVDNLVCAGRCVSVEGQVLGPVRVMAPCMAMGEAAGVACSWVVGEGKPFSRVDTVGLREKLRSYGCIVDVSGLPEIHPRVDQV